LLPPPPPPPPSTSCFTDAHAAADAQADVAAADTWANTYIRVAADTWADTDT
jgi:hypothetical protein